MSPRELLVQLREKGVEIKSNGDRLLIDAPKGAITPDVRDALAANKAELLKILNTPPPVERPAAPPVIEKPAPPKPVAPPPAEAQPSPPPRPQTTAPPPSQIPVAPTASAATPPAEAPRAASSVAEEIKQ